MRHRGGEAREAFEVGLQEVDQADGLAGRREVERADVQVLDLLRREQGEAAPARHHAGQVVRQVVVGRDAGAVADPDAGQRVAPAQVHAVLVVETRQAGLDRGGADVDRRLLFLAAVALELEQHLVEAHQHRREVEAAEVLVVEQAAPGLRRAEHRGDGGAAVETAQVGVGVGIRAARRLHHRPAGDQAAQHQRFGRGQDVGAEVARREAGDLAYRLSCGQHGGRFSCSCGR